jgi:hypothetical protein
MNHNAAVRRQAHPMPADGGSRGGLVLVSDREQPDRLAPARRTGSVL